MLRGLYDWTMRMAASKRAPWALAAVSFAESSFFPIPPDIMLIPMVLSDRRKAWWYATVATVASVIGGILGYAIGYYFFEAVGLPILKFYGREHALDSFMAFVQEYGVEAVIIKGATPIPYKVVTIAAGVGKMNLGAFLGASIVARAMRFYLVAGLLYFFGEPIRAFIEKRLGMVMTVFLVLLVGGFVAVKYIF
ncbi:MULTISPECIES: YqaA family protein [unclassified Hyphomicrobium]|uniref:YqaA family protein n=1 Tax=unclassified Hyphomicrobium TaxID=2619925 RepID=UPI000213F021|nr:MULTISPECIES: YqaA family protein [unclassified Hyphomicrobium]CCB67916.1 putative membrane protein, putative DedA family protein [Hyphomicrobium sp. MC1]